LETLADHTDGVVGVAFSPDGATLASVSLDRTTKVWDIASTTLIHELVNASVATGVAFSPDGALLAVDQQLWSVGDWQLVREMDDVRGGMGNIAFSPDGKLLAAGNAWYEVRWWRVADGTLLHTVKDHADSVNSVAFSPDGKMLTSGSLDGTVRLWRVP
jgi:WD40 repeat protein